MDTSKPFGHAETGSYYLVVKSSEAQMYILHLEALFWKWRDTSESHIVWGVILRNVPLGYLSETLANALGSRLPAATLSTAVHAQGVPPSGEPFETLYVYYAAQPGFRNDYDREIRTLDESWRSGAGRPADGFVSSTVAVGIDVGDVDRWLVACIVCRYLWHPDKDSDVKNPRYEALLRDLKPELPPIEKLNVNRLKAPDARFPLIETKNLTKKDLPTDDSVWFDYENEDDPRSPMRLALSFAGYEFLEMRLFELLTTVERIAFDGQPRVLECFNTTGLRLLLFGLQRRQHSADSGLETDALTRAIIAQLRIRLAT